jgi:hypothetical protein
MSGSPESIVVAAAGVDATFHLFGFAADLIPRASMRQSIEEK